MSRWLWCDRKYIWKGDGEDRDGWKVRETIARAAAANWRYAHLQMLKGIGKGVDRGPKTKHMTKITLNMKVKSLIGVVSFRHSLRFHIGFLMRSARMFVCFLDLYHAPKLFTSSSASSRTEGASQEMSRAAQRKTNAVTVFVRFQRTIKILFKRQNIILLSLINPNVLHSHYPASGSKLNKLQYWYHLSLEATQKNLEIYRQIRSYRKGCCSNQTPGCEWWLRKMSAIIDFRFTVNQN